MYQWETGRRKVENCKISIPADDSMESVKWDGQYTLKYGNINSKHYISNVLHNVLCLIAYLES